jgi:tetratricopeptide (TPR) repeat protein
MPVPAVLIGLSLALGSAATGPPTDEQILARAEAAYREGLKVQATSLTARNSFARAAAGFEELRRRGADNPSLYVNLGQAYLLAGDLPRAILAYQRGLRLDPDNADLQERLEDARNQVVYTTPGAFGRPPVDNWPPWLPRLTMRTRLVVVLFLYSLACVCFTRWLMTRPGWCLSLAASAFSTAAFLGVGLAFEQSERSWEDAHPLVVLTADKVVLHKGDGGNYPCYDAQAKIWLEAAGSVPAAASALHRGVEARLRFDRGRWVQIELASGEVGWVRRRDILTDSPDG